MIVRGSVITIVGLASATVILLGAAGTFAVAATITVALLLVSLS